MLLPENYTQSGVRKSHLFITSADEASGLALWEAQANVAQPTPLPCNRGFQGADFSPKFFKISPNSAITALAGKVFPERQYLFRQRLADGGG